MIDPSGVKQLSDLELDAAALTVLFPKELMDQAFTLYDFQRDSDSGDYQFELAWDAARWTIIPDLLVIDAPRLQVSGEQGMIAAQLTAVIDLAGLPFLISLEMPAGRGAAYLLAAEAGKLAVADAKALSRNAYKIQLAQVAVKRAILQAAA